MKKLHLLLVFTLGMLSISAQKIYFVYIQTEPEQPFFVKMNKKTLWSSPAGYIILPKLVDSSYNLSIGFPQNRYPEQNFTVTMNKKDHGFLLKNFQDKGWGLFDLQSLQVHMAVTNFSDNNNAANNQVNAFTEILAKAADDPSLKEKTTRPKTEEVKTEPVTEPVKETTTTTTTNTPATEPVVNTNPTNSTEEDEASSKKSKKKKQKDSSTTNNVVAKNEVKPEPKTDTPVEIKDNSTVSSEQKKEEVKTENKPVITEEKKEEVKPVITQPEEKKEVKTEIKPELKDPVSEIKKEETKPVSVNDQSIDKYKASEPKKYAESSTTEGFGLVYIDNYSNGSKDTIRLMIPNPKPVVTPVKEEPKEDKKFLEMDSERNKSNTAGKNNNDEKEEKLSKKEKKAKKEEEKKLTETPVVNNEEPAIKEQKQVITKEEPIKPEVTLPEKKNTVSTPIVNSCAELATEDEFVRLRKKMAGKKEVDMVDEAKKVFKSKCFSTSQVRTLGRLFETDEERYNFFDAAYKHVFNPEDFPVLQSEFQDSYYSNRFKAMLR